MRQNSTRNVFVMRFMMIKVQIHTHLTLVLVFLFFFFFFFFGGGGGGGKECYVNFFYIQKDLFHTCRTKNLSLTKIERWENTGISVVYMYYLKNENSFSIVTHNNGYKFMTVFCFTTTQTMP